MKVGGHLPTHVGPLEVWWGITESRLEGWIREANKDCELPARRDSLLRANLGMLSKCGLDFCLRGWGRV